MQLDDRFDDPETHPTGAVDANTLLDEPTPTRLACLLLVVGVGADMKIRDIMSSAWLVRADDTLWRAERIMARRRRQHLPVVAAGMLVGMLSERDVLAIRAVDREWWLTPVHEAMHEALWIAAPDDAVSIAADRIGAAPEGLLPVLAQGYLVGVVTATDLLDAELASSTKTRATAADVMTDALVTVAPTDTLTHAMKLMADHQIRHLPVVANGAVVGCCPSAICCRSRTSSRASTDRARALRCAMR